MVEPRHALPGESTPAWREADESAGALGASGQRARGSSGPALGTHEQAWRLMKPSPRHRARGGPQGLAGSAGRQQGPTRPWPTRCEAGEPIEKGECPWEWAGACRRDREPHRGQLVLALADASLLLSALSLCLGFLAVMALALGVAAWVLASHDLGRMRAGVMDPGGLGATALGRCRARAGVALGLYSAALWGWFLALLT
jgi:hypothetical protein